jgi:AcrR family transcriptional regulator
VLAEVGYSATNIERISKVSGVARGSILHQFPTRLDLMAGVLEFSADTIVLTMKVYIDSVREPLTELRTFCDLAWAVSNSEIAVALAEIQNAAHWDESLATLIRPASDSLWQRFSGEFCRLAQCAGIANPPALIPSLMLLTSGLRGLVIALRVSADREVIEAARAEQRSAWIQMVDSRDRVLGDRCTANISRIDSGTTPRAPD